MHKIRLGILDDHEVVLTGLGHALEADTIEICVRAKSIDELLEGIKTESPDLLLMDVVMPGSEGVNNFEAVLNVSSDMPIIAYTSLSSKTLITMLYKLGVMAYVSKDDSLEKLKEAIKTVFEGHEYYPEALRALLKPSNMYQQEIIRLSRRENEVLHCIAEGITSQETANRLFLSVNTVDTHRKNLFTKFQVNNIAALVAQGQALGFIH